MCDPVFERFSDAREVTDVLLPYDLDASLAEYAALSRMMVRAKPPEAFSRDEWGYLCTFFRELANGDVFRKTFGQRINSDTAIPTRLAIPKDEVAIWLPNNVSLLGPLTVILCLLTGARVRAKAGSNSANLTKELRDFVIESGTGPILRALWSDRLETERFSRFDERNTEWSRAADIRLFFGGDASAIAVENLPHKAGSSFFAFADHSSQIWAEVDALDDKMLETILRVFHVYGRSGCTSPQQVMLIGADRATSEEVAARICSIADTHLRSRPPGHIASDTLMAEQVGRAKGWSVSRSVNGSVVFPSGGAVTDGVPGQMTLCIIPVDLLQASEQLPENIQTIGYAAQQKTLHAWLQVLSCSKTLRVVPVRRMHHFGPFWDGQYYWRALFREMEIGA